MSARSTASRATPEVFQDLVDRFGSQFTTSEAVRAHHGDSPGDIKLQPPDAVLFVRSTDDVVDAVKICARHACPIIPFGTGTSVEGHVSAIEGGVTLDFTEMNSVLEISPGDFDCRVQPGVTREQLNTELRATGLFFPVDPGANASLGGMAGTGASGTTAVRYGTMRQHVLGMEVVLANGEVVRTGGRAKKSSAGYDLTKLLVGSEGTLAITTELTLQLHPIPQVVTVITCAFPGTVEAVEAATEIMQFGLGVSKIELVDTDAINAINAYSKLGMPVGDYLFLEFGGTGASVEEDIALAREISERHGLLAFERANSREEIGRIWKARHNAAFAALALIPNSRLLTTDVCVPFSRLAQCIAETREDCRAAGITSLVSGHVGDGNFHVGIVLPPSGEFDDRAHQIHDDLVRRAIAMGGTCTGEHGIGIGKQEYLKIEHGSAIGMMKAIKAALDPLNILNPGKIFQA